MERTLPGMLFLVAALATSIAVGSWWMQRIAFTPDATRDTAAAILGEPDIRLEINGLVSAATEPVLGEPITEISARVENDVLSTRAGAAMMAPIIERLHRRIIGLRDEPVEITGVEMIEIVRDQRAAEAPTVTMPVEPIGTLENMRRVLGWLMIISAVIGLLAFLLGVITRPERRDVLRGLGEFGLAMGASLLVFGYLVPVHLLTAIDNRTWTHAVPRLAMRTMPVVLGGAAVFAVVGTALILASMTGGKRRQWSTPLSVARYRGGSEAGWS
jgi:hypothetical protein